ncbi:MAG TPA: tyrosine-type recombinase/integrase [Methylosinus sp.]|jgi:integrase|uniref:tyrosine-type recombinase/integrase n=1 Tax=Methylosinus sp. TaxID=427 RepID=UPI002F937E29
MASFKKTPRVFKRKDSPYWVYDFQIRGIRFNGSTKETNRKQAETYVRNLVDEALRGAKAPAAVHSEDRTFAQAVDDYARERLSTIASGKKLRSSLDLIAGLIGADKMLSEFDHAAASDLLKALREHKPKKKLVGASYAPRTLAAFVNVLRSLLSHARDVWRIPLAPIQWRKLGVKVPPRSIRDYSFEEESAMYAVMDPEDAAITKLMIDTGLRLGNAVSLRWSEVRFEFDEIHVWVKPGKPHIALMTPRVRELLLERQGNHPEFVFTYCAKTKVRTVGGVKLPLERYPVTKSTFQHRWDKLKKILPFLGDRHDCRRTSGTRIARYTGSIFAVMGHLGHTNIAQSMPYIAFCKKDHKAAMATVAQMEKAARGAKPTENEPS